MTRLIYGKTPLTNRERVVMQLHLNGASFGEIGRRLGCRRQSAWESYRAAMLKAKRRYRLHLKKERVPLG